MPPPGSEIVTIADRPDLVPTVATWLWETFWREAGYPYEAPYFAVINATARIGPPQCFVLMMNGEPIGTASLAAEDLDERPELSPWLAGVFIVPKARGWGYVRHLILAVEDAAKAADVETLWLFTAYAERVYLRAGWRTVERLDHRGTEVALMRRDLSGYSSEARHT